MFTENILVTILQSFLEMKEKQLTLLLAYQLETDVKVTFEPQQRKNNIMMTLSHVIRKGNLVVFYFSCGWSKHI